MAEYLIQDTTLTAIADAVRSKTGSTASLSPSEIATEIGNIKTGFPNGTEWTLSDPNISFASIHYDNGIWVGGSDKGVNKGLYYSIDGITWTRSNITDTSYFKGLYYANGIWVANTDSSYTSSPNVMCYSADGITWTNTNVVGVRLGFVYYSNIFGQWYASSSSSDNTFYYSTDGITWNQDNISGITRIYDMCEANGIIIMANNNGLQYSTDGVNWTTIENMAGKEGYIYNANGVWICIGKYNTGIMYSTDGITWMPSSITVGTGAPHSTYNANGIWVFASKNLNYPGIYYSTDGVTWTQSSVTTGIYNVVKNANGIWVAGSSGSNFLYYSIDGITWTPTAKEYNVNCVNYGNGVWVMSTANGIHYSIGWTPT